MVTCFRIIPNMFLINAIDPFNNYEIQDTCTISQVSCQYDIFAVIIQKILRYDLKAGCQTQVRHVVMFLKCRCF